MTPAIELNEFLIAVRFPLWPPGHGYAFVEFARRHGDFAIVSAAALLEADKAGKITRASVTIGGVGVAPVRASEVEQGLLGQIPQGQMFRERARAAARSTPSPTSTRRPIIASISRPCCRAARWKRPTRA